MKKAKLPGNQKGVTLIVMTLALTMMLSCTALVIDIGRMMIERQKMQVAVDAAAIAAAYELPDTARALTTAKHYAELNGVNPTDITVTFSNSNRTVDVKANKTVEFVLAKLIGVNDAATDTLAEATLGTLGGPFNYAIFSGSTTIDMYFNGQYNRIEGSIHGNRNFTANSASYTTVTGAIEAHTTIVLNNCNNTSIGSKIPNAPIIPMPDFSEQLRLIAEKAGTVFVGDKIFNGQGQSVDKPIYVKGNVYVNQGGFKGKGAILATGDIIFNGSDTTASPDDAICFYSINGNIYINQGNTSIKGILYAPKGNIYFNGNYNTILGSVVGNNVIFNQSHNTVTWSASELASLPSDGVRLVK